MRARTFWTALLVTTAIGSGIALSVKPWAAYFEQRRLADQRVLEKEAAEKNLVDLTEKKVTLESPIGREKRAREQGYRRENEVAME